MIAMMLAQLDGPRAAEIEERNRAVKEQIQSQFTVAAIFGDTYDQLRIFSGNLANRTP